MPIIAHDLRKSYGSLEVLKGLNLTINDGETLVIVGRSGVGKSVLLRQIIGIEEPDSGYVEVNGKNLSSLTSRERDKETMQMGMLFQSSALFDSMNVGENVAFYLRQHNPEIAESEVRDRVALALKMVDLHDTESKLPSELSGGMRKRAALARLIVYRPKILLYDEPTTGLDPITAMHITELINKTRQELKATSIVVTHEIRYALEVGDRLALHSGGVIQHVGSAKDFMKIKDEFLQKFLGYALLSDDVLKEMEKRWNK
jgi:phospholipid/cholesterol/gamma-HCH transport system ATP-binding protein